MSNIYNLEPPTRGSLTLRTTHGPISIALWADESPRATKSVVQHALNSYYDGIAFHRVVPGVLIQGGDPSGTGSGGGAAFPGPLRREAHGRIKFRRRGLVALVADDDGLCGSQFFITLAETPWLNGLHTILGTVVGNTIFNALALAEAAKDAESPPKIIGIDVVDNPFPEIVKNVEEIVHGDIQKREDPLQKVAVRDKHKLSFAQHDEDDDDGDDERGYTNRAPKRAKFPVAAKIKPLVPVPPANAKATSQHGQNTTVDKAAAARAEFDRLRAALLRGGAKKSGVSQKTDPASSEKESASAHEAKRSGKLGTVREKSGIRKRDAISVPRGHRRGKSDAKGADVLQKLAGFEKKILAARRGNRGARSGEEATDSWFAKPLTLPGARDDRLVREDADEYEAREGLPKPVRGRFVGQGGHSAHGHWSQHRSKSDG